MVGALKRLREAVDEPAAGDAATLDRPGCAIAAVGSAARGPSETEERESFNRIALVLDLD